MKVYLILISNKKEFQIQQAANILLDGKAASYDYTFTEKSDKEGFR